MINRYPKIIIKNSNITNTNYFTIFLQTADHMTLVIFK